MRTSLIIWLILYFHDSVKSEFRHHQDRYSKENITSYPWFSTIQHKSEEKKVTEITHLKHQSAVTSPEETFDVVKLPKLNSLNKLYSDSEFYSTKSVFGVNGKNKGNERKRKLFFFNDENKSSEFTELETSTKNYFYEKSNFYLLNPTSKQKPDEAGLSSLTDSQIIININHKKTYNKSEKVREKINSDNPKITGNPVSFQSHGRSEKYNNLNFFQKISDVRISEPLVALTDATVSEGCVENVVEDFTLSDDLVTEDVLTDRNGVEKLTTSFVSNNDELNRMTDIMKSIMEKHSRIASISVTAMNRAEDSKTSETVYRKENDLFVDSQSNGYSKILTDKKPSWTPLFWNCLTKTWVFGYYFIVEKENKRIYITVYFNAEHINGTIDQCKPSFWQILDGGPKCDPTTTKCALLPQTGFMIGGYKCVCQEGYYFPVISSTDEQYFKGFEIEKSSGNRNSSQFKCFPCPETCPGSCSLSGFCTFKKNNVLNKLILCMQVISMLITISMGIFMFKHRKCQIIPVEMNCIMEICLLGCLILYVRVIIQTFDSSTLLCLIEPWCREVGFVLCYGAIILKLYRILIEFRTRKAHRWVIRDKDLLKYLLGMVIVVVGYMSAWTATNLYLIQKENYSMLSTGITRKGFHFNACKTVWWDYITETSEILILIFGVHLSYASRNATTKPFERCFLCLSISLEAVVSTIFYIIRFFYWETMRHPDLNLMINVMRCHFTTTLILLMMSTPTWLCQKIKLYKARVSRNYLTQELGRGPLEAFKPQDGVTAANNDVDGEISLADMNPEDIRAELKRLYTQLEVLKNKTIRFENPHISKRRGGRKIAHRRFSLQALRHQTQRQSTKHTDVEITEAEASRTPEDSVCSNEGPSVIMNDGPSEIVHMTPKKVQI